MAIERALPPGWHAGAETPVLLPGVATLKEPDVSVIRGAANDYAEVVISAVHEGGGDILKLIGDGVLAIFEAADPAEACCSALHAAERLRCGMRTLNERRTAAGDPVTSAYLALHIGEVFFGNIGSEQRLDFTVIGPAVNEVSRIAAMCRSAERGVLVSPAFAAALPVTERDKLVSVGRYALRGVGRAQELFTLDPAVLLPLFG